ncbi:hypothetical protein GCM10027037_09170 [Mucilaginibacter koreensis]
MKRIPKKRIIIAVTLIWFAIAYAKTKRQGHPPISGKLDNAEMNEVSDMVASSVYPNTFYVHNDSGDSSRFFSINAQGHLKTTYHFQGTAGGALGVQDCEEMAVGPGPEAGKSYLYMGDIGDNGANRRFITVYRFDESELYAKGTYSTVNTVPVHLVYPDRPHDAEAMMVDPVEKLLYIVTKRTGNVTVYTAPLDFKANDTLKLIPRCQLHFKGLQPLKWIVAGDIAKDGSQILLKSYVKVYYWKRNGKEPVWQAMMRKAQELPYEQEKQGEAIGFAPDGKSYYTTSEGLNAPIYHYSIP